MFFSLVFRLNLFSQLWLSSVQPCLAVSNLSPKFKKIYLIRSYFLECQTWKLYLKQSVRTSSATSNFRILRE